MAISPYASFFALSIAPAEEAIDCVSQACEDDEGYADGAGSDGGEP